jgi:hypothetical protein
METTKKKQDSKSLKRQVRIQDKIKEIKNNLSKLTKNKQ